MGRIHNKKKRNGDLLRKSQKEVLTHDSFEVGIILKIQIKRLNLNYIDKAEIYHLKVAIKELKDEIPLHIPWLHEKVLTRFSILLAFGAQCSTKMQPIY